MGSVEVDAKIRGDDGATLQEPSKYHTRDELQKEVIDLDRLNPDVNGDGKVSASEARIYSLLRKQDVSGDGKLTIGELYKGLEALTKVDKKRSLFTKGFGIMSLVSVLQVLLIVGLVAVVLVATKARSSRGARSPPRRATSSRCPRRRKTCRSTCSPSSPASSAAR